MQRFSNEILSRYPHMSAEESIIWGSFLSKFGSFFKRFDYDLRVGEGIQPDQEIPENFRQDYIGLTQKRIDAVGYNDKVATLFEVKVRANLGAIGQLLGYKELFLSSFPSYSVSSLHLVCSSINPDELKVISKTSILVDVV